uniref:Integrase zinc-binding domain-containing protein n=1 Tax=Daphnia galeata TaxID=27404 RepID=A0A8J2WLP9_9CRUS|nr:unnamed protein product [Daphnia galeata]
MQHLLIWSEPLQKVKGEGTRKDTEHMHPVSTRGIIKSVNSKGQLRVGGRLNHANLPECTRHPVILKQDHALTLLIVKHCHDIANHASVEKTLEEVRSRWVLKRRRTIRRIVKNCVICQKQRARPTPPLMAALPKERHEVFSPPFTRSMVTSARCILAESTKPGRIRHTISAKKISPFRPTKKIISLNV